MSEIYRQIKTFVLRAGRMTESQHRDYENLSGRWVIPYVPQPLNYIDVFDESKEVVVEIGFGMGKATSLIAQDNPSKGYIGIEVHRPGVGRLLGEIHRKGLQNLYIIEHDAVEVLEHMIPDSSVSAFHIFFPDPWPKKKHHKRRFIQKPRTDLLCKKLSPGGYLYMATDWQPYAEFALNELSSTEGLENVYEGFAPHQEWRPETRFEEKGKNADREIFELFFKRNA